MAYADTKHAVVVAAAATGLAKWNALRTFFNGGGSTRWTLANPADPTGTGLWLVAEDNTQSIVIRRDATGVTWYVSSVIDGLISSPGNTTNPVVLFGGAEPDNILDRAHTPDTGYTKMLVYEHDDAITIMEYGNASENTMPKGIHAGIVGVAADPAWVDAPHYARVNGVLVGVPSTGGTGTYSAAWFANGTAPASSYPQQLSLFGEAWWPCCDTPDTSNVVSDVEAGKSIAVPIPIVPSAQTGSARFLKGGFHTKWLRYVSCDAAGAGPPGTRYEVGTQGWCRISPTNTTAARLCVSCELAKAVH